MTRGLAPLFTDYFTVITFSPRSSDQSSPPKDADGNDDPTKMSSTSMAEDLESLRTYLDIPTFPVLMGHSNAGSISLAYAELHPDRVEKLVLIGGQLLGYDGSATFKKFAEERAPKEPFKKAYETWGAGLPKTDEEFHTFLVNVLPSYFVDPDKDCPAVLEHIKDSPLKIWNFYSQSSADQTEQGGRIGTFDEPPADQKDTLKMIRTLGNVKAKTLCSYGKEDMICAVEAGQMTVDNINAAGGKAEMAAFETCGHFPWVEKKEEFMESTLKFLEV